MFFLIKAPEGMGKLKEIEGRKRSIDRKWFDGAQSRQFWAGQVSWKKLVSLKYVILVKAS